MLIADLLNVLKNFTVFNWNATIKNEEIFKKLIT